MTTSLNKSLKKANILQTDIGNFEFVKSLGEGGNSFVFHFNKGEKSFAIKFLKKTENSKLNRFKDEYFCAAQIPSHKNIAQAYHFDKVTVDSDEYFIIIMKHYQGTLSSESTKGDINYDAKAEKAWSLFVCLATALSHLHSNQIIHRDLKPQNVFFDQSINEYVIGDLGIAHFSDEVFERESKTKPSERMANFGFSAPEQIDSKGSVKASCDIYSLGQVIYWYLTGKTIRGLNMEALANSDSPENLKYLDRIVKKCLINDASKRFQSIAEISEYLKELKKPPRHDYWPELHKFDDAIRKSLPKIKGIFDVSDEKVVKRFLDNFHDVCKTEEYWYMNLEGGDNTFTGISHINDMNFLFCGITEIKLSKLLVYRDSGYPYKNFFVLLMDPSEEFNLIDEEGNSISRELSPECSRDYATLWNDRYIDCDETDNGYFEFQGDVITVDRDTFKDRIRHLKKYAYIVVPKGTATARMMDRTPTERFLESIVKEGTIEQASLRTYLDETRSHHSSEITMYN
jgi:serine/threonine protein kinase